MKRRDPDIIGNITAWFLGWPAFSNFRLPALLGDSRMRTLLPVVAVAVATFFSVGVSAEPALDYRAPVRPVGWGTSQCDRWQLSVATHVAVLSGRINPEVALHDEQLSHNFEAGKKDYDIALEWVSGYFSAAQRFGVRIPVRSNIATSEIVEVIEQICRNEPSLKLEEAAFRATQKVVK